MGNQGGRPSLNTPSRLVALSRGIADGLSRDRAAAEAGISKRTLQRWIKAGRAGDPRYVGLAEAVATAERRGDWGREIAPTFREQFRRRVDLTPPSRLKPRENGMEGARTGGVGVSAPAIPQNGKGTGGRRCQNGGPEGGRLRAPRSGVAFR
ncbi:hypothetical protein ElP_26370 [Tautonia plasticadhaerens]|uniref:Uncharacterized protein n=1 Tax=Tautonia plasticadhaerens TaxID=2527974 RepID=A0A518H1N6_9BACT|nr:hypothetical protein ElP_26370 [Tautonia plasticadhaerens]